MAFTHKSSYTPNKTYQGRHRFEHWYRDHQIYFLTARCRERFRAFASEVAKAIFWDRFNHYVRSHGFEPFVTTLLDNHYHTLGYLERGAELGEMMRKLHGSVAKLVNDILPERRVPFWHDRRHHDYFDGCIRDEKQLRLAYRYVLTQSVRHGIVASVDDYPHTIVTVTLAHAIEISLARDALMVGVPYQRYEKH
ncbi:MAG: transposase [Tepidisphaeraceae bacterium]